MSAFTASIFDKPLTGNPEFWVKSAIRPANF